MSDDKNENMPSNAGPLSQYMGEIPPCPGWFTKAIATGYETRFVRVNGARIHYQSWSSPKSQVFCSCMVMVRMPIGGILSRRILHSIIMWSP